MGGLPSGNEVSFLQAIINSVYGRVKSLSSVIFLVSIVLHFLSWSAIAREPGTLCEAMGDKVFYVPPESLDFSLEPIIGPPETPPFVFSGKTEVLVGDPTNVMLFFETSPDFLATPSKDFLPSLRCGEKREHRIAVIRGKGKPDSGGSWLRMRMVYLPDYQAMASSVASDTSEYPDPLEHARLLFAISQNQKAQSLQTNSIRFFW